MPSALDRIDIAPPRDAGAVRSFGLALLVHAALIAALTWGVNWKRSDRSVAFEAELWSSVPQEAAPRLVAPAPLPSPAPSTPTPAPPPPPLPPRVEPAPKVIAPPAPKVDIALDQEKKRKLLEQKKARAEEQAKAVAVDAAEAKADALAEKERKLKQELAKTKALEDAKKLDAKKLDAKKQATKELAAKEQATAAATEDQRKANIARSMGLAGATGNDAAKGAAQKSSGPAGPSASYGGKVRAKVKPNIVFTEDITGNPSAEVEVRTALDGTVMSQRLVKSSGNKAWDDAVVKAIIRTEVMPRDADGRVPTPMILEFRPKD